MSMDKRESGSALVIALIVIVLIVAVVGILFAATSDDLAAVVSGDRLEKARLFGESGVRLALAEVNSNRDLDAPGVADPTLADHRIGYVIHGSDAERVVVRLLDPTSGAEATFAPPYLNAYLLEVTAQAGLQKGKAVPGSTTRRYNVFLKRTIPFPSSPDAAVAILGDPSKGKVEIKKDVGLAASGYDRDDPTTGIPGLGIEGDPNLKLKFQPDQFIGMVEGTPVTGAQPLTNPQFDFDVMDTFANAAETWAENEVAANPGVTISDGSKAKPNVVSFGTDADSITVIDGSTKGRDFKNVQISGQGTLIITGDIDLHDSSLNWNGDVFVLGDVKDKAEFKIDHSSSVTVNGGIYLLGADDRKAKLRVKGDDGKNLRPNALTVNGPIIALADKGNKNKQGKADVNFNEHQSSVTINGYLGVFGDRVKVKIKDKTDKKDNGTNAFALNGALTMAVPDRDKTKVDFKMSGPDADVLYDSSNYRDSLDKISRFLTRINIPPTYTIASHFEVVRK